MKKVLLVFLILFAIKIGLSFFINGLLIFPDETCFFLKAKNFSETLHLSNCADLSELKIGNPYPLFSILISPVFLFFQNFNALHIIFIINSLLSTLIIFPIYSLLFSAIKNNKKSLIYAGIITLLPIVTAYEKMLMSETLFIFLGIFSFYFYKQSLDNKNIKSKIISFILSIAATFTRPFGFILPISYAINEFTISKNKKRFLLILIITIILAALLTNNFIPNASQEIIDKINSLKNPENYLLILKALKNQINSLSIETILIPSLIFFSEIFNKKDKNFKKIKYFLLTFIFLNLIISAQHIYKYLLAGFELDISTRYLNLSIVFIIMYFFILIEKTKEIKIKAIIFTIFIFPLFFLSFAEMNHALNITMSPWYKSLEGFIEANVYFNYIFLPTTLLLLALTLFRKKQILIYLLIGIFLTQSIAISAWQIKYSQKEYNTPEIQYFKNKKSDILMLKSLNTYTNSAIRPIYFDYLRIKTLSSNNIRLIHFNDIKLKTHDENDQNWKELIKDFDYIITPYELSLEKVSNTSSKENIYLNKKNE